MTLARLESELGYAFRDGALLERALTHRSYGRTHNERLEFLGDALLGAAVAMGLGEKFPAAGEHDLTLMRASLVRKPSLAAVARELELGEHLRLGVGERKSGGFRRDSILADAFEAVIGAVLEDGGFAAALEVVSRLMGPRMDAVDPALAQDPKTRLQEAVQARRLPRPRYRVLEESGADHERLFRVECRVAAMDLVTCGEGHSRRDAEKNAARSALEEIEHVT